MCPLVFATIVNKPVPFGVEDSPLIGSKLNRMFANGLCSPGRMVPAGTAKPAVQIEHGELQKRWVWHYMLWLCEYNRK